MALVLWPLFESMGGSSLTVCHTVVSPFTQSDSCQGGTGTLTAPLAVPAHASLDASLVLAKAADVGGALVQVGPAWQTPTLIQVPLAPPV